MTGDMDRNFTDLIEVIFWHLPEEIVETHERTCQDSPCLERDLNLAHPKDKFRALTLRQKLIIYDTWKKQNDP
jgi:hypothetical protein